MPNNDNAQKVADGYMRLKVCWALFFLWLIPYAITLVHPIPILGLAQLLLPIIALIQGSILYGWRGIAAFLALGIVVGFTLEASSVANGFPFGSYTHNVAGPKPAGVAPMAIVAYAFIGWFSLLIGKIIAKDHPNQRQPFDRITVPIISAFILAGLDLPLDPMGATITKDWTYAYPSGLYGVPLTNLLGWIFTGWVLFQLFVLVEGRFKSAAASGSRSFWALPCFLWLAMMLQFISGWHRASEDTVTSGSRTFVIADIYEGGIMISLFSMAILALIALNKLYLSRHSAFGNKA